MSNSQWTNVDNFLVHCVAKPDAIFEDVLRECDQAGLPTYHVSACQGKFLSLLVSVSGARTVLEVGTLGGYSTIWLAKALPESGQVVTLEVDPHHAEVARNNFRRAGVEERIDLRVGSAAELLPQLVEEGFGPVDLTFIDADKVNNGLYTQWALKLSRPGSIIVVDNVVRDGAVLEAESDDPSVQGVRECLELLGTSTQCEATAIQTVGVKGYDGFAIARVIDATR